MIEIYDCFEQVSRQLGQDYLLVEQIYYYVRSLDDSLQNIFPDESGNCVARVADSEDARFWCEQKIKLVLLLQTFNINITELMMVVESLISYKVIGQYSNGAVVLKNLLALFEPESRNDPSGSSFLLQVYKN